MKKRLRKKKFRGEFAVYGFACRFRLHPPLTPDEADRFWDDCIAVIERHDLSFGGGCGAAGWDGIIQHRHPRSSATQAHREAVSAWLSWQPSVCEIRIGRLTDLHYGFADND